MGLSQGLEDRNKKRKKERRATARPPGRVKLGKKEEKSEWRYG